MISYRPLDQLVLQLVQKYSGKDGESMSGVYSDELLPYSAGKQVSTDETSEIVREIVDNLNNLVKPYIDTGLETTASSPPDSLIHISSGSGIANGHYITLSESVDLRVPLDGNTRTFYINLDSQQITIEPNKASNKLPVAKIVIPKPGTTAAIQDDKPTLSEASYHGWIVSGKDILFDGKWTFDDDSIAMLGNKLGYILADNIFGTINLSENLKISNAQGTLSADSKSLKLYYTSGNVASKFDRNGVRFYDDNNEELAKFTSSEARVGNIVISTNDIQSGNFVEDSSGFRIKDDGAAEFENVKVRGVLKTSVFEKDTISSVGGTVMISSSDILSVDMTALDASTLTISGEDSFANGDILRIKDGSDDEWMEVASAASAPTYTVTRDKKSSYTSNNNPVWKKGTAVIDYGATGEGIILLTSSESNSPRISFTIHSGSPWLADYEKVRIGNLNGYLGYVTDKYGIGIGEDSKYLKYDPSNGLRIAGHTLLGSLDISTGGYIASGQSAYNAGVGYWLEYNTGTPRMSLGDPDGNYLTWDGTNLAIKGSITVTGGNATQTFYQNGVPTSISVGDLWVDTDDSNKLYVAHSIGANEIKAGEWVVIEAGGASGITTFRQSGIPTALTAGDLWIDTDDNKIYRATAEGDNEISAGEWVLYDYMGWGHTSDVTKIDGGDIYTNTVTATQISVSQLDAINANTGTLTVDEYINAGTNVTIDGDNESFKVFGDAITIETGVNDKLDWIEEAATKATTLTASTTYTSTTLAAHVQTLMRAAGDADTTVVYSSTTKKITIANSTLGTFTLKWSTGTNTATTCGRALGFDITADDSGALTYAADYQAALRVEMGLLQ